MQTILTDIHTDRQKQTDKPMAIGEILQICLKILKLFPILNRPRSNKHLKFKMHYL